MTKPWDKNRQEIVRLYIKEGRTLQEVRTIMKTEHSFEASTRSYRQWFDKWRVGKYNCKKRQERLGRISRHHMKPGVYGDLLLGALDGSLLDSKAHIINDQSSFCRVRGSQDHMAGAVNTPSPKVMIKQESYDCSPQTEIPWSKCGSRSQNTCQDGAFAPDIPRYLGPESEYFSFSPQRYSEPCIFALTEKYSWYSHDYDLSPQSVEYDLGATPGLSYLR